VQICLRFNPNDSSELVTNGARRVYFWRLSVLPAVAAAAAAGGGGPAHAAASSAAAAALSYYSPPLVASDFRQAVGDFLASVFVPGSSQVCGIVAQVCGVLDMTIVLFVDQ